MSEQFLNKDPICAALLYFPKYLVVKKNIVFLRMLKRFDSNAETTMK
jgi:hypothetical protein